MVKHGISLGNEKYFKELFPQSVSMRVSISNRGKQTVISQTCRSTHREAISSMKHRVVNVQMHSFLQFHCVLCVHQVTR
jgi:hypothetical protein